MRKFGQKVAAITGASSGIGRALAVQFARQRCDLALCSHTNEAGLAETARMAEEHSVKVTAHKVDVADRSQVEGWADDVVREHGRVNLIINNAGVAHAGTVDGTSIEEYEWIMGINYWGVVYGTKAFLPHLQQCGDGHVVNVCSIFGLFAKAGMSAYNSSKFAMRGFTEALRQELDLVKTGVSATCVHPGGVRTNLANRSRISESVKTLSGNDIAASRQDFDRLFGTTADEAADEIIRGIRRNAKRVLIGFDARVAEGVQRLMPTGYQRV